MKKVISGIGAAAIAVGVVGTLGIKRSSEAFAGDKT